MPIYEYQCTDCGHHFDVIQKMNDDRTMTCPKCSEEKATRLVSAAGFQLKGTGWYATDFKTKEKSTSASDSASPEGTPSTESVKTDTPAKPATTTGSDT